MRCFVPPVEPSQGNQSCTSKLHLIKTCCSPRATLSQNTTHHNKDVVNKHHIPPSCSAAVPHHIHPPLSTTLHCFLQSLLTGLMYYRPDDPIDYLEGCLKKARELGGPDKVRWDTFVGQEKKSLPPLNGGQSRRSLFRNGEQ